MMNLTFTFISGHLPNHWNLSFLICKMKNVTILPPKAVLMVAKKDFKMIIIQISIDLLKANNLGGLVSPACKSFRVEDGKRSRHCLLPLP